MKPFEPNQLKTFRTPKYTGISLSLLSMFVLTAMIVVWNKVSDYPDPNPPILVLAEESLRKPLVEIAQEFLNEFNTKIEFTFYDPISDENADENKSFELIISTDFGNRKYKKFNKINVAGKKLIFASRKKSEYFIESLNDITDQNLTVGISEQEILFGQEYQKIYDKCFELHPSLKKKFFKNKYELIDALNDGAKIEGAIMFYNEALGNDFIINQIKELKADVFSISCKITDQSEGHPWALQFARYLAAEDRGQAYFKKYDLNCTKGDPWNINPKITIFCEKEYHPKILSHIPEFKKINGCEIDILFPNKKELISTLIAISQSNSQGMMPDLLFVSKSTAGKISPNYSSVYCKNKNLDLECLVYYSSHFQSLCKSLVHFLNSKT